MLAASTALEVADGGISKLRNMNAVCLTLGQARRDGGSISKQPPPNDLSAAPQLQAAISSSSQVSAGRTLSPDTPCRPVIQIIPSIDFIGCNHELRIARGYFCARWTCGQAVPDCRVRRYMLPASRTLGSLTNRSTNLADEARRAARPDERGDHPRSAP